MQYRLVLRWRRNPRHGIAHQDTQFLVIQKEGSHRWQVIAPGVFFICFHGVVCNTERTMKKFLINLVCCFVPSEKIRHKIRRFAKRAKSQNNIIEIVKADGRRIRVKRVPGCQFRFTGDNNHVVLHEPLGKLTLDVNVSSGVSIEIHGGDLWERNIAVLKQRGETCVNKLVIGKNFTSSGKTHINFCEGSGDVIIGDDCMFSWDVQLRTGDFHTVYDSDTKELLNPNKDIFIGNHVWLGAETRILKGAVLRDETVVGTRAVVTKGFDTGNIVVAGCPATIIKNGIGWSRLRQELYSV